MPGSAVRQSGKGVAGVSVHILNLSSLGGRGKRISEFRQASQEYTARRFLEKEAHRPDRCLSPPLTFQKCLCRGVT